MSAGKGNEPRQTRCRSQLATWAQCLVRSSTEVPMGQCSSSGTALPVDVPVRMYWLWGLYGPFSRRGNPRSDTGERRTSLLNLGKTSNWVTRIRDGDFRRESNYDSWPSIFKFIGSRMEDCRHFDSRIYERYSYIYGIYPGTVLRS